MHSGKVGANRSSGLPLAGHIKEPIKDTDLNSPFGPICQRSLSGKPCVRPWLHSQLSVNLNATLSGANLGPKTLSFSLK